MKIRHSMSGWLCAVAFTGFCAIITGAAFAQAYPTKPIRILITGAPGASTDFVSRTVGEKLSEAWAQPVIYDHRPAAGGAIAYEFTAKAPPDGYTLVVASVGLVTDPVLYKKVEYDPIKSFAPVTQLAAITYVFAVSVTMPAKTLKEYIAVAKSRKTPLVYASGGGGNNSHLGMELLKTLAGFDAVHIPYKGDSPAMIALLSGEVESFITGILLARPQLAGGKIRALATTGSKRTPLMPDVPTVAESGFPDYSITGWYALLAPAGTPQEAVSRLYQETSRILKVDDVRRRLADNGGAEAVGTTPEEVAAHIKAEMTKLQKLVIELGLRAD